MRNYSIIFYAIFVFFIFSCSSTTLEEINHAIINKNNEELENYLTDYKHKPNNNLSINPLKTAIDLDSSEAITLLISYGFNPNIMIDNQNIADYLISTGHENLSLPLISSGLDPNLLVNGDSESILYWAVLEKNEELIKKIISSGGNVNFIKRSKNISVIDLAIRLLPDSYLKYFIKDDTDLSIKNKKNSSYLMIALQNKKIETAIKLVKSSAYLEKEFLHEDFLLKIVMYWTEGSEQVADILLNKDNKINEHLPLYQEAIKNLNINAVKWLLGHGFSPYSEYIDEYQWYGYNAFNEIDLMRKKLRSIDLDPHEKDQKILDEIESIISNP